MLFSVVIPTFNYGRYLGPALDSVLAQPGEDHEVIVVDDGSTDDTRAVVARLTEGRSDRVRYLYQENAGPSAARNRGAEDAAGRYLVFLDADDQLKPNALRLLGESLTAGGSAGAASTGPSSGPSDGLIDGPIDLAFGGHDSLHEDGTLRSHPAGPLGSSRGENFARFLRRRMGSVVQGSAALRRERFLQLRYPEGVNHNEDVALIAQLLATGRCVSFPDSVVTVRKHADSLRHDATEAAGDPFAAADRVTDMLFDPAVLPAELMAMRREYRSRFLMTQFATLFRARRGAAARRVFRAAVREHPAHLLHARSLLRYVRSFRN